MERARTKPQLLVVLLAAVFAVAVIWAATALAAGGSAAAAHLVRANLGVRPDDPRLARALASEREAHDVAERMLESTR